MKYIIFALIFFLASCKETPLTVNLENKIVYYKIGEVNNDGKVTETPIKYVKLMLNDLTSRESGVDNGDDDDDDDDNDDDDDDDDDDYEDCPPLDIDFESFKLNVISLNSVNIVWESVNETNVNHYSIMRSFDGKNFKSISIKNKETGKYSYIDKF